MPYLKLNLDIHRTENYNIKIDIISDFMAQAIELVADKKFHPAASSILMGASLEEFLKKIAEEREIDLSGIKMTIDPISRKLYEENIITKQDLKDIISWAGIRNEATHGNFEEVNDRKRISNAIEGVNLFMRKLNRKQWANYKLATKSFISQIHQLYGLWKELMRMKCIVLR